MKRYSVDEVVTNEVFYNEWDDEQRAAYARTLDCDEIAERFKQVIDDLEQLAKTKRSDR